MNGARPYLIFERDVVGDVDRLNQAWSTPTTFAFLGDKSGITPEWVEQKLSELPVDFHTGHFVLLTSGSTGRPKLVVGRRDRAERLAAALHTAQASEPVRETICTLPLTYCYAFVNQWLWSRQCGRRLVMTAGLARPDELKLALAAASDAMLCLVGAQIPLLVQFFAGCTFPGVIRVHFAGGRFPQEQLDVVRELFPSADVYNNYGCAEAMPRLTLRRAEAAAIANHVGWPLPGIEMRADANGRVLFRSPYGAVALADESGLNVVGKTDWLPSGDLGRPADDGHWELLGREGEVFKRYGEKISLQQILGAARDVWPGQIDFYLETDARGETGYVLMLAPRPTDDEVNAVLKHVGRSRPRTHWPLRIESVEQMPLLPNGKPNRQELLGHAEARTHWRQRI